MIILFFVLLCCSNFYCEILNDASESRARRDASKCAITMVRLGFVVNGHQFVRGKYPWMVALMLLKDSKPPIYFCGGSLVSSMHVLTGNFNSDFPTMT